MGLDLDSKATQSGFAKLVGVSQQAIQQRVAEGQLPKGQTYGQWLYSYCAHLREEAAGRSGDDHAALTRARTLDHEYAAELKMLQIKERAGELVPMDQVEPRLLSMVTAARTELLTLPASLAQELRALYGVEVDPAIIEDRINDALTHLATSLQSGDAGNDDEGGEGVGSAA